MTAPEPLEERLMGTLRRYTSEATARSILHRVNQIEDPSSADAGALLEMVMFGARLFVEESRRDRLMAELTEICYGRSTESRNERYVLEIADEHSCRRARMLLRRLVRQAQGNDRVAVRGATALNELCRHAITMAGSGRVEIDVLLDARLLRVTVLDEASTDATRQASAVKSVDKLVDNLTVTSNKQGTKVVFELALDKRPSSDG